MIYPISTIYYRDISGIVYQGYQLYPHISTISDTLWSTNIAIEHGHRNS